jgi:hypothetical protein
MNGQQNIKFKNVKCIIIFTCVLSIIHIFGAVHHIRFVKETPNITKTDLRLTYETHRARSIATEIEIRVFYVSGRIYFVLLTDDKRRLETYDF